jgi:hypothetical protein
MVRFATSTLRIEPFLICGLPTLFFGSALTAAIDAPPRAKNNAR